MEQKSECGGAIKVPMLPCEGLERRVDGETLRKLTGQRSSKTLNDNNNLDLVIDSVEDVAIVFPEREGQGERSVSQAMLPEIASKAILQVGNQ